MTKPDSPFDVEGLYPNEDPDPMRGTGLLDEPGDVSSGGKKKRKKFRETKFGSWVTEKFLPVAGDLAGNVTEAVINGGNPVQIAGAVLKTFTKVKNSPDVSPETRSELLALQIEFYRLVGDQEIQLAQIEMEDRSSAREREVSMQSSGSWLSRNATSVVGLAILVLTFSLYYAILAVEITADKRDIVYAIVGALTVKSTQVISYYFGSSTGSADKARVLERIGYGQGKSGK